MWHDLGPAAAFVRAGGLVEPDQHADHPATKRRLRNLVEASGLLDRLVPLSPRPATLHDLELVHTPAYIARVEELDQRGWGDAGEAAPVGPGSYEIARLAAGGCLRAVDAVLDGEVDNSYALVRPAGHHALADRGMGSCLFANIAIAALHALRCPGVDRVAIVDWDVHHGNGSEAAFWTDPRVLTISLHQASYFPPGSGAASDIGEGSGRGTNLNIPLPPGSGHGAYVAALERAVAPAITRFDPDLVLVASGYDANAIDPLGRMMLHSRSFARMTEIILAAADQICNGRVAVCHEGGYSAAYVPFCGVAVIEVLAGVEEPLADPFLETFEPAGYQELQPHQESVVVAAEQAALVVPVPAGEPPG
jgi:acetoin utilization deacetylase AcuC-like enzyme